MYWKEIDGILKLDNLRRLFKKKLFQKYYQDTGKLCEIVQQELGCQGWKVWAADGFVASFTWRRRKLCAEDHLTGTLIFSQWMQTHVGWWNQVPQLSALLPSPTVCCPQSLSHVQLFVTQWTVTCQAPLSVGFSRPESWSGLPFPPPGEFPNPGIKPASATSPALAGRFF